MVWRREEITMTDTTTDQGSRTIGSLLAVPIFLIVYLVVAVIVNVVMTFMNSIAGDGPTRWVELLAFGVSGFAGVYAGRWVLDKALRSWSGWPTFVTMTALMALANFADWFLAPEPDWWVAALKSIQSGIAIIAMWAYLIRRDGID